MSFNCHLSFYKKRTVGKSAYANKLRITNIDIFYFIYFKPEFSSVLYLINFVGMTITIIKTKQYQFKTGESVGISLESKLPAA